jgi:hypothetical protein
MPASSSIIEGVDQDHLEDENARSRARVRCGAHALSQASGVPSAGWRNGASPAAGDAAVLSRRLFLRDLSGPVSSAGSICATSIDTTIASKHDFNLKLRLGRSILHGLPADFRPCFDAKL